MGLGERPCPRYTMSSSTPSFYSIIRFLCCPLILTVATLGQGQPGASPVTGAPGGVKPDSIGVAYSSSLWPKVAGVATVYYVIDAASDPNATPKIQTAINQFNSDFTGV